MQPEMSTAVRIDARRGRILIDSSCWARARSGSYAGHGGAAGFAKREALDYVKHRGNKEDPQSAGREHTADDGSPHDLTSYGTRAASGPQRDAAENKSERSH